MLQGSQRCSKNSKVDPATSHIQHWQNILINHFFK